MVFDSIVVVVLGFSRREQRLLCGYLDGLRSGGYREIEVQRGGAANFDGDGLRVLFRKSRGAHGDGIGPRIDLREEKTAILVGLDGADGPGVDFRSRDVCARQRGA